MTKNEISQRIDHTNVKPDATEKDIIDLCDEAKEHNFRSVCVTSSRVSLAKKLMKEDGIVISVIGFPFGAASTEAKVSEATQAISDGADEIDVVINIGLVKDGSWEYIGEEISKIAKAIKPVGLKVIMEVGFLTIPELRKACRVAKESGTTYLKTSTGYGPRKTTKEDIRLMKRVAGGKMKIKASGGVHDLRTAKIMIKSGADVIGTSSGLEIIGVKKAGAKKDISGSHE